MEVLIAIMISVVVLAGLMGSFLSVYRSWRAIALRMEADREVNNAMSRMVYGMGTNQGLRAAAVGSVTRTVSGGGWTLAYRTDLDSGAQTNSFTFSVSASNLVFNPGAQVAGRDISLATVILSAQSVIVTVRVDKVRGPLHARREVGTEISLRN